MKKILILESDVQVVGSLAAEFSNYDCIVESVEDAEMARQKASTEKYDMVVISTTLKKSHGFLAFTFLKRIPELERVPFVIMYSAGEEDQIVSHQNRPTHADVYIQKPFDFADLMGKVADYLGLDYKQGPPAAPGDGEEVLDLDEAIVIDEPEAVAAAGDERVSLPSIPFEEGDLDKELAALETPTDELIGKHTAAGPRPVAIPDVSIHEETTRVEPISESLPRAEPAAVPAHAVQAPDTAQRKELEKALAENKKLAEEIQTLRSELKEKEKGKKKDKKKDEDDAAAQALKKDFEEARAQARTLETEKKQLLADVGSLESKVETLEKEMSKKGAASTSTRELLDLRDLINKKDKEIVKLKDDINTLQKDILEFKDKAISLERVIADHEEKFAAKEGELGEANSMIARLSGEKEGLENSLESLHGSFAAANADIEKLRGAMEELKQQHAGQLHQKEEQLGKEAEEQKLAVLAEQETRLNEEKQAEIGSLKVKHEREHQELKDQYEAEIFDIRDKFESDLQGLKERSAQEKETALSDMKGDYEAKIKEFKGELKDKEQVNKALMKETAAQEKQLEDLNQQAGALKDQAASMEKTIMDVQGKNASLESALESARAEIENLKASLVRETEGRSIAEAYIRKSNGTVDEFVGNLKELVSLLEHRDKP